MNKNNMYVYFDTEFTGLRKNSDLISLGAVIEQNWFYGEFSDADFQSKEIDESTNDFLNREVIPGLMFFNNEDKPSVPEYVERENNGRNTLVYGDKKIIAKEFCNWVGENFKYFKQKSKKANVSEVVLVSDVLYYDMVLLMDILNLIPNEYPGRRLIHPVGLDINDIISFHLKMSVNEVFDANREQLIYLLDRYSPILTIPGKKHNALYDARVIQQIHKLIDK